MPHQDRHEGATLQDRLAAATARYVTTAAERGTGEPQVVVQLVRHAARRCEIMAARRASLFGHAVKLTALLLAVALVRLAMPVTFYCGGGSRVDMTTIKLKKYAFEAYPSWAAAHPDRDCPDTFAELDEYMNRDDRFDAWGRPLKFMCGPYLPDDAKGLWVSSAGEDGRFGTEDDLVSSR